MNEVAFVCRLTGRKSDEYRSVQADNHQPLMTFPARGLNDHKIILMNTINKI